jgi:excisionase family DNA binding protein
MTTDMKLNSTLTVKQAAEILGVTVRAVHDMIERGELTVIAQLPGLTGAKLLARAQVETLAKTRRKK